LCVMLCTRYLNSDVAFEHVAVALCITVCAIVNICCHNPDYLVCACTAEMK